MLCYNYNCNLLLVILVIYNVAVQQIVMNNLVSFSKFYNPTFKFPLQPSSLPIEFFQFSRIYFHMF